MVRLRWGEDFDPAVLRSRTTIHEVIQESMSSSSRPVMNYQNTNLQTQTTDATAPSPTARHQPWPDTETRSHMTTEPNQTANPWHAQVCKEDRRLLEVNGVIVRPAALARGRTADIRLLYTSAMAVGVWNG